VIAFLHRRITLRSAVALAVAVASTGLLLCTRPGGEGRQELVLRLIPKDAGDVFDAGTLADRIPVFTWRFRSPKDVSQWRVFNLGPHVAVTTTGLRVRFQGPDPQLRPNLVRTVGLEADQVDAIEVVVAGSRRDFRNRGSIQLYWSAPGQDFEEGRSLRLTAVQDMGDYVTTYTFPVVTHPLWAGRIDHLRLDPTSQPDDSVELRSVQGVKYRMNTELLQTVGARKVSLAGDLRSALLASPGRSLEWQFVVPANASFLFSYGVPENVGIPVRFSVSLERAGQPRLSIFHRMVGPGRHARSGVWHEGLIDLSSYANKRVKLVLEAIPEDSLDPRRGLPAWGNPEVWQKASARLPPNLILISLDTLRADHLSLYGYGRETSPNLDRWARRRAAVFMQAVAPSPWTLPSHASLFTGLDALRSGVNQGDPIPRSLKTIPERLRQAGYATVGVTGGGYVSRDYGFDRGFDSFSAWPAVGDAMEITGGLDRARHWLRTLADRPFFLFFHTYAIHAPYLPREPYFARFSGGRAEPPRFFPDFIPAVVQDGFLVRSRLPNEPDRATVISLYDAGIAFADEQVGKLLEDLRALDLERRTVVMVVSDHGEGLGERGLANHFYLYDFNLLVPLIVSLPDGRGAGRRFPEQVRLLDVPPTLLELAGTAPPADMDGVSLLPLLEASSRSERRDAWSYAASTNFGISLRTSEGQKYIFNNTAWPAPCGKEELYRPVADPTEQHDLAPDGSEAGPLRTRVGEFLRTRANGISVRFANGSSTVYTGSLEGTALHQVRTKVYEMPCPDVSWNELVGRIDFTVRPGKSFSVLLEGLHPGPLRIRGMGPGAPAGFEASLDPSELARPWQISYDGSGWRQRSAELALPQTGIVVRWVGDWRLVGATRSEVDQTTRDQLLGLGYIH
jgi:arylsulfatase A-like enzyme